MVNITRERKMEMMSDRVQRCLRFGPLTSTQVAERLGTSTSSVTAMLNRLVSRNLVEKITIDGLPWPRYRLTVKSSTTQT